MTLFDLIWGIVIFGILFSLSYAIGTGLLKLRRWALNLNILVLVLLGLGALYGAIMNWRDRNITVAKLAILPFIFFSLSVYYFTRPRVKEKFE